MKASVGFMLMLLMATVCEAQQKVQITPGFEFRDGIYLSFNDFKNDNPIPLTHLISDLDIRDPSYVSLIVQNDSVFYFDNLYEERTADTRQIWGFVQNGKAHVGFNTDDPSDWQDRGWFPIIQVGAYSYFTAVRTIARALPPTPGASMRSRGTILDDGIMYPDNGQFYQETVPVQLLLVYENGALIELGTGDLGSISPELIRSLISKDAELLQTFESQSKREQKRSAMFMIRRYNERNPVFLSRFK